jgi:lysophospholipase L1-like esterase
MRTVFSIATLAFAVACSGASGSASDGSGGQNEVTSAGMGGVSNSASGSASSADGGAQAVAGASGASAGGASVGGSSGSAGASSSGGGAGGGTSDAGGASVAGDSGTTGVTAMGGGAGSGGYSPCPAEGTPCVVMPLGDSITFGYGSTTGGGYRVNLFSKALADGKTLTFVGSQSSGPDTVSSKTFPKGNEGHSGYSIDDSSKTSGISPLVDHAIATYKPNIILLMIGTNDMHYSLDLANAPTRLGNLLDQISADAPNALVVVAKIIPANGAQNTPTQAYNAAIPAVVQARVAQGKHFVLVDMFAALKTWSTALYKDSEHPNDTGYGLMADTWYPAIANALR